jgi:nucleoside-diphosphate-sugar epimerase
VAILVSGASGFLGRKLITRLVATGREIVAIARRSTPKCFEGNPHVHWLVRDIAHDGLDLTRLPDIESVVHLAGATLGAGKDENLFLQANEQTIVRLLQSLANVTDRFVFASSQVVYGDACHLGVTEDFPLQPDGTAYACSKVNSENWMRWFQKRCGGQYLALRFCGFLDGGGLVDYIIDRALAGETIELYSQGAVRRDYLPSSEGIDALVAALNYSGELGFVPVNIGSGQAVSALEMATAIQAELQASSQIMLHTKTSPQGNFVFCIERAKQMLGFQPSNLLEAVRLHAKHRRMHSYADKKN